MTRKFLLCAALLFAWLSAFAQQAAGWWSIDMPEGFYLAEGKDDGTALLFRHEFLGTECLVKLDSRGSFRSAKECIDSTMARLLGRGESDSFVWRNSDCALADITVMGGEYSGQAATFTLPESGAYLTVAAYSPAGKAEDSMQVHYSILDSVFIDRTCYFSSGIITSFAFPRTSPKKVSLEIDGKRIQTQVDSDDAEAERFVIDREFSIMKMYVSDKARMKHARAAWQRYYRQIFRSSFERLEKAAFDIFAALNSENCTEIEMAQKLLTWTQGFKYGRDIGENSADFTPLTAALCGEGSDCDSRAMLLCVLLQQLGIDAIMYASPAFGHALLGAAIDAPGMKFETNGREYLLGETTAPVTFGMAPQEAADRAKWVDIMVP